MRIDSTLYYVLKDHLGSASVMTDASGNIVGEDRFYPFGETRFTTGTMYTDKLFTGQREITGLDIYHYNARFYSPKLGRFLSADTIVPGYTNPQNLNRYSYVRNDPIKYIDPSGHGVDCGIGMGDCVSDYTPPVTTPNNNNNNNNDDDDDNSGGSQPELSPDLQSTGAGTCGAGYYSPHCLGWHFYRTTNIVCPAYLHCTAAQMQD